MTLHTAYLGLGGNLGAPDKAMAAALRTLDAQSGNEVVKVSSLYRTPPWGKTDQPDFLNASAQLRTELAPRALLDACLAIEKSLKRVRGERWGPRLIDIDILAFDTLELAEEGLIVPHPRLKERAFALVPLSEIAPQLMIGGERVDMLLEGLDRTGLAKASEDGNWWQR